MEKDFVIDNNLEGLYFLLPLMKKKSDESDEGVIEGTVKIIETIENEALRQDLLAAMIAFSMLLISLISLIMTLIKEIIKDKK